jgi:plastocyanin
MNEAIRLFLDSFVGTFKRRKQMDKVVTVLDNVFISMAVIIGGIFIFNEVKASDNEIFVDQVGVTANIDLEQLGSGNIIGGLDAIAGTMTALDLDGTSMTLDINQIGNANKFLGDMYADSYTGYFNFDGDTNTFTSKMDPTNAYGADNSNVNVQVTGSTNTFTLDLATVALSAGTDLDWTVQGSSNTINADIDVDGATNYMNIDGDSNTVNYDGDGYAGGYFHLTHTGDSRAFTVDQASTLDNDWLKVTSSGNNGTVCVNQNDQGTAVGC